jgi:hypothetical protein
MKLEVADECRQGTTNGTAGAGITPGAIARRAAWIFRDRVRSVGIYLASRAPLKALAVRNLLYSRDDYGLLEGTPKLIERSQAYRFLSLLPEGEPRPPARHRPRTDSGGRGEVDHGDLRWKRKFEKLKAAS